MRFVCWHAQEVHCPFFISRPAAPEEEIELEGGLKLWKRWVKVNSFIMIIMTFWVVSFQTCVNFMYFHPYVGRWSRFDPFWRILFQVGLKPPTSIGWLVDLPECILSALDDDNQVHWTFAFFIMPESMHWFSKIQMKSQIQGPEGTWLLITPLPSIHNLSTDMKHFHYMVLWAWFLCCRKSSFLPA